MQGFVNQSLIEFVALVILSMVIKLFTAEGTYAVNSIKWVRLPPPPSFFYRRADRYQQDTARRPALKGEIEN
jgi:hypothetical protein